MSEDIVTVETAAGMLEAEILRGLLESGGVQVWLSHEAAGTAIGINIAALGNVDIMVLKKDLQQAREILDDYRAGRLEDEDSAEDEP
jgi:hypothetical protein